MSIIVTPGQDPLGQDPLPDQAPSQVPCAACQDKDERIERLEARVVYLQVLCDSRKAPYEARESP